MKGTNIMSEEKSQAKLLQERLFSKKKNGMLRLSADEVKSVDSFC